MHLALLLAVAIAEPAVLAETGRDEGLLVRMERIRDWPSVIEAEPLRAFEIQQRLTGIAQPAIADIPSLHAKLARADECEARYDSACATQLRQEVVAAYDASIQPSQELAAIAARALHDLAAGELAEGRDLEAGQVAFVALRRFANVPLDTQRHSPRVEELFRKAALQLKKVPKLDVTFTSTRPGTVVIDGAPNGRIDGSGTRKVAAGDYRVWFVDASGISLSHVLNVAADASNTVEVDFALESKLSFASFPVLDCGSDCVAMLKTLALRTGATQAVGVRGADNAPGRAQGLFVRPDGTNEVRDLSSLADVSFSGDVGASAVVQRESRLSATSFIPFGVGQFAQKRYVVAGIYAGLQAGLLGWHIAATLQHQNYDGPNSAIDDDRRKQRNLSGTLLIGAMVANIAEAVIVDLTR